MKTVFDIENISEIPITIDFKHSFLRNIVFARSRNLLKKELTLTREILLKNILKHASLNSSFYKRFNPSSINNFPVISKNDIRKNWEDIYIKNNYFSKKFNTGGSTGEPFNFILSKTTGFNELYHQKLLYNNIGFKNHHIIASFDGTPIAKSNRLKKIFWKEQKSKGFPYGHIKYSSHYFNSINEDYYIKDFLDRKPDFIRGYPSFISDFCLILRLKGIKVNFIQKAILTAENINQKQIDLITSQLNCKVYGQYGNSEATVFAISTENKLDYHCSPYYSLVEILNDNDKHVSEGEEGRVVTTSFFNYNFPFIRYDTGDRAIYGGEKNGVIKLQKLLGREQDFIFTKDRTKINITGIIFGQHFKSFKNIKSWQIQQFEYGKITIVIIPDEFFSDEDKKNIKLMIQKHVEIEIDFTIVDNIPLTKRGKFLFVINHLCA